MTACPLPRARFVTHIRRFPSEHDDSRAYCTCARTRSYTRSYPHSRGGRANLNPRVLRYHPLFVPGSTEWLRLRNFHKGLLCGVVVRYCRVIVLTSLAQQHVPHSTGRHIDKQPSGRRRSLDQRHCTSKVLVVHELHPPHSLSGTIQAGTSVPRSWAAGGTCSVPVMSVNGSGRVPLLS